MVQKQRKFTYLIVDDEFPIVKILSDILAIHPSTHTVYTAHDGERALHLYKNNPVDIIITDVLMPKMSGIDLIKHIKALNPDCHIIVVSAFSNIDLVREAIRNGAYDYILKPFAVDEIMFSVNRLIERIRLLEEKKNYILSLEKQVNEATRKMEDSFMDTLKVILNTLEARHTMTLEHSEQVADYAVKLARSSGVESPDLEAIRIGALLHDIGKIGVRDAVLLKPGALNAEEWAEIKKHCAIGRQILEPALKDNPVALSAVLYHHERYDGKGYPEGLSGKSIPVGARIVMLANALVAMKNATVYRPPLTQREIVKEIEDGLGTQFDPEMGQTMLNWLNEEELA